ncbi:hypothetical protein BD414DRAFT_500219 [Trametes punicea]|nr:hypothetical protein BD414DRAFT_500219 [Trametes punicea]
MTTDSDPPWFARNPDGSIHFSRVPDCLLHHPGLQRQGVVLNSSLMLGARLKGRGSGLSQSSGLEFGLRTWCPLFAERRLCNRVAGVRTSELTGNECYCIEYEVESSEQEA